MATSATRKRGGRRSPAKPRRQEHKAPPLLRSNPQLISKLEEMGAAIIPVDFATEVTPKMAELMLQGNVRNRHMKVKKVEEYVGALERNEWRYNGDTVRVTTQGKLLDGQHRLQAILDTGIPAPLLIAVIEDDDALKAQATMDVGSKRSFGDMLQIEGVKNAVTVAAATAVIWGYEHDGVPVPGGRNFVPTIQQKYDVLERHPGLHVSVSKVGHKRVLVAGSLAAGLHYLFSTADEDDADEFFRLLQTGDGLGPGNAIYTLRERLIREEAKAHGSLHQRVRSAFLVIAWNHWRQGNTLHKITFRPGGARPDRFPAIDGVDKTVFKVEGS